MRLLAPLTLGPRTAPNRVLFGPHVTNLAQGRSISARHVEYYRARAAGGCGTIVVEEASVDPSDWPYERSPWADASSQGWADVVEACRPHGALVFAALGHAGGQGTSAYHQRPLWAPSDEPEVNTREVPKVMEPSDIDQVITGFGLAANLAARADLDGVEINAGQHSLIRQFLSGLTNRRSDQFGVDRTRLLREVLSVTRAALGPDRVVGLRLSCDEMAPWAGLTPEDAAVVATEVAPLIDYLVVVRGSIFTVSETRPTLHHPPGFNLDLCKQIHDAVGGQVQIVAQGSIVDPGQAEWALEEQRCDAVEMTRAQIAEPALVAKLQPATRLESATLPDPRPCLLCNQQCQVRDNRNPVIGCVVNPLAGRESQATPAPSVAVRDSFPLVIGGGVAGLEAARGLASGGLSVRLIERSGLLGGVARTAATTPAQARIMALIDWLVASCEGLGVQFELATNADQATVETHLAAYPDSPVVVATGGAPAPRRFACHDDATVVSALEVLRDGLPEPVAEGDRIIVWDPIGGPTGVAVAEFLARENHHVALCTPDAIAGNLLALSGDLAGANTRLQQAGVAILRRQRIRSFANGTLRLIHTMTSESTTEPCRVLVDAGHRVPHESALLDSPLDTAATRIVIGDAVAPRSIAEAMREGAEAANRILADAAAAGPTGTKGQC